jgi:hypothetical protein
MPKILKNHAEIRLWAEARAGSPMMMDVPDGGGDMIPLLQITFGQHALNADHNEGPDRVTGGYALVSWDDWFAEFDRQHLGIKVHDEQPGQLSNEFEFVGSDGQRHPSRAAQKPAAA